MGGQGCWTIINPGNRIVIVCSIIIYLFSGNFIIPCSQKYLSFLARKCCWLPLQSFRDFFLLEVFWKYQNKLPSENIKFGKCVKTSLGSCNDFCLVQNTDGILHRNSDRIFVDCLIGCGTCLINRLFLRKKIRVQDLLLISPERQHHHFIICSYGFVKCSFFIAQLRKRSFFI